MSMRLDEIYRFPVKGLSPEKIDAAPLEPGHAIPGDRRFALALASTPVDGPVDTWMAKQKYMMLMRDEKLAQLQTVFDDATDSLTILRGGRQVARGVLSQPIGRTMIEDFFAAFMGGGVHGRPRMVEAADGFTISDHPKPVISLINRASVADLKRVVGTDLDPLRFRGNFLISGLDPWAEFDLVGKTLQIGDCTLQVFSRIERCAATNVNPATAERDQNIPRALQHGYGHVDCGVYAKVMSAGTVRAGDEIKITV